MNRPGWRHDAKRRWSVSIVAAFAIVAVIALLAEQFVERALGIGYEIHWLETVPIITLLFAWVLQKGWKSTVESETTSTEHVQETITRSDEE